MSLDTRTTEVDSSGTNSVTEWFMNPNPFYADDQTLALIHFNDPIEYQSRRLRQKVFLNTVSNYKFKLELSDREKLLKFINNEAMFVSTMMNMGFSYNDSLSTYYECHKADGGPVFNEAALTRSDKMLISNSSVNDHFGKSARFDNSTPLIIQNDNNYFRKDEGTIEFWLSPIVDTLIDPNERCFFDIYSAVRKRLLSTSPTAVVLSNSAKKIVSVKLLQKTQEFSSFYSSEEQSKILFDEIYRDTVSGRLIGGTGSGKDFAVGSTLSADGKTIMLSDALPGHAVDVIVTYVPVDSNGDRISIYKDAQSKMIFSIIASGKQYLVTKDVDWKRNTWHRVMCMWKANSSSDTIRMFVDGTEVSQISFGDAGLLYGIGFTYGQLTSGTGSSNSIKYNIKLKDEFKMIAIGSDLFGDYSATSRVDNIRFSRVVRETVRDSQGSYLDINFSSNTNSILPTVEDDLTTLMLDFEPSSATATYATVVDPVRGIFDFDIQINDSFGKINNEETEDIIVELVKKLKPAHSNALVKFPKA